MGEEQNILKDDTQLTPENTDPPGGVTVKEKASTEEVIVPVPQPSTESNTPAMEVHKHPHHVTHKKNWKEYLLEFLMIFLAVFLGFVAENIREHLVEKERAKQYANSLISDLKNDTAMVNSRIKQITSNMTRIDTLSSYVYDKNLEEMNNFDLLYKSVSGSYNPYTWNRATLEQIKSSGSLRYFNDSIVKKISAYDAFTRHMDYDYQFDQNQWSDMSDKSKQIFDMNYPTPFVMLLYSPRYDSLKNTPAYNEMRNLNKPLLTKDINNVKVFVNQAILLRSGIRVRRDVELPSLVKDARNLIQLLKEEYHVN